MTKDLKEELNQIDHSELPQTLSININAAGQLQWNIPKDMTVALFLIRHLEVIIDKMIDSKLQRSFEQSQKIIKPGLTVL